MIAWWDQSRVAAPVLLANQDNAAIMKDISEESDLVTSVQEHAYNVTSHGGIKTG